MALEYADRMTITNQDVDNKLFSQLRRFFDEDALRKAAGVGRD